MKDALEADRVQGDDRWGGLRLAEGLANRLGAQSEPALANDHEIRPGGKQGRSIQLRRAHFFARNRRLGQSRGL
jgi:hypothetical protein